jgi:DNA invertase Pin-like site-specific DNA recombinase
VLARCLTCGNCGPRPNQTKVYFGRKPLMPKYVAYFRVSTLRQGRSGLGLAAQQSKVAQFLGPDDELVGEFVEIESGRSDERTELWRAIAHAKRHEAKLLIAKLDRFSRRVSFIASIMDQGIRLAVAEMPHATDFQLHIFAALAQEERRLISERTCAALAEAKRQGRVLGSNAHALGERWRKEARCNADRLRSTVLPLLEEQLSYSEIARRLNASGVRSARGGAFHPQTVLNLAKWISAEPADAQ